MFERYKNTDGKTYNGVAMLAEVTGLSYNEIAWTAARIKELMLTEGKSRREAIEAVKVEAASKPWVN